MGQAAEALPFPGEILRIQFLEPRGLTISAFSAILGISRKHLSGIINGQNRITAAIAVRLSHHLGTTPRFWLDIQATIDIHEARRAGRGVPPV